MLPLYWKSLSWATSWIVMPLTKSGMWGFLWLPVQAFFSFQLVPISVTCLYSLFGSLLSVPTTSTLGPAFIITHLHCSKSLLDCQVVCVYFPSAIVCISARLFPPKKNINLNCLFQDLKMFGLSFTYWHGPKPFVMASKLLMTKPLWIFPAALLTPLPLTLCFSLAELWAAPRT